MEIHVAKSGSDGAAGTVDAPLVSIGAAAALAQPGDSVVVHEGVYREWVNPPRGGTAGAPITYRAASGADGGFEAVTISGAEVVDDWRPHPGAEGVWTTTVPNSLFGEVNPYAERIGGDWFFDRVNTWHTGEVYLDGKSMYESLTLGGVERPEVTEDSFDQAGSLLTWYCEAGEEVTTIWANFGGADPGEHEIEINARKFVFWPEATGIDHIAVRGFTLTKAATQWAPPTALQEGLIGPHWSKGWVIEDNTITDSKNVGVSLGKEASTGQNEWGAGPKGGKGGTQREREVIQRALALRGPDAGEARPWHRDHVGSHTVRRNTIRDCEQAGIVGHLGAAFSTIADNHISRIHVKRQWHGAEVAGIKLHAAIDTVISGNTIHHTHRALWLDWQAQGTLVRRNVFYASTAEDFMVEVCHGPYLVDSNLFLSPWSVKDMATGGAYVHNYFAGRIANCTEHQRYTPYHLPHDTAVYGVSNILGGDDRFYNNVFVGDGAEPQDGTALASFWNGAIDIDGVPGQATFVPTPVGTSQYDAYPTPEEYPNEDGGALAGPRLPVSAEGNVYAEGAEPFRAEPAPRVVGASPVRVEVHDADAGTVRVEVAEAGPVVAPVTTARLGTSYQAEMGYTDPDGSDLDFGTDFDGLPRDQVVPGPFAVPGTRIVKAPGRRGLCGRGSGGLPLHQAHLEGGRLLGPGLAREAVHHEADGLGGLAGEVLGDGGELRGHVGGDVGVVVADHRDVPGHGAPGVREAFDHADSEEVGGGEDRRHVGALGREPAPVGLALGVADVDRGHQVGVERDAVLGQDLAVALEAFAHDAGGREAGSGEGDAPVAQGDEVAHGEFGAAEVVGADFEGEGVGGVGVHRDEGDAADGGGLEAVDLAVLEAEQDGAVEVPGAEGLGDLLAAGDAAQHEVVVQAPQLALHHADDLDGVRVDRQARLARGGHEEADEARGAAGEAAGGGAGDVAALLDDAHDALAGGRGDPRLLAVDDIGHGHEADAGLCRDVLQRDAQRGSSRGVLGGGSGTGKRSRSTCAKSAVDKCDIRGLTFRARYSAKPIMRWDITMPRALFSARQQRTEPHCNRHSQPVPAPNGGGTR
ncbi:right-handed parallel beta-helix repeat-containing protein [Glycomyces paridis]|uniref:Right-handed parallel beta-helix repeat-containing protein n=1 Tax=Glycomyces paridis TaxID=2126555 RepID=A0A4S8P8F7_9ACTN|nr:right-handed parallel beta-helix repeat-containing protein [Glycomyces paridis]